MARKKAEQTEADDLALPESFEKFAEAMEAPEPAKEVETRPMGGMVEKTWSGIPMWECARCKATTFDKAESSTHVCKTVRYEGDKRDD